MNCQDLQGKIADCLCGGLDPRDRPAFEAHLAACDSCRQELEELNETWSRLGILGQEIPGPGLRAGFYKMLESYKEGLEGKGEPLRLPKLGRSFTFRVLQPALRVVAAVVLVAAGFAAGYWLQGQRSPLPLPKEVSLLRSEVDRMRQVVSLSLLDRDSAADRLQAVSLTSQIQNPNSALLAALLQTLDQDPNVSVRLAAVEALYLFADQIQVREALNRSLERQTSPLVQIALIDLIVALREKRATAALHKLLGNTNLSPEVRERARTGIRQLI